MNMWLWTRTLHDSRFQDKRWQKLKIAGMYLIGALLLAFGIAVLGGH